MALDLYRIDTRITRVAVEGYDYGALAPGEVKETIGDDEWQGYRVAEVHWDVTKPRGQRVQAGAPPETPAEQRARRRAILDAEYPPATWRDIMDKRIAGDGAPYAAYLARKAEVEAT
jgi:hypothetical protein